MVVLEVTDSISPETVRQRTCRPGVSSFRSAYDNRRVVAVLPTRACRSQGIGVILSIRKYNRCASERQRAVGIVATTAAIIVHRCGSTRRLDGRSRDLKELVVWRRQLIKSRTVHRNQLEHASYRTIIKGTKSLIEQLDKQIERVEKELNQLIDDDPHWSNVNDILQSIPGVGPETARTLIVECPDLGEGEASTLCSLAGLVPFNRDSGPFRGQRHIHGGRSLVQSTLYMAALAAVKSVKADNVFKQLYGRITAKRPHKVGLIAVAHKMLLIAHSLVKNNVHWKNKLLENFS